MENPKLWSAEKPYLYNINITLRKKEETLESFNYHLGVRRVEVKGEVLLINGQPVKLKGVNIILGQAVLWIKKHWKKICV